MKRSRLILAFRIVHGVNPGRAKAEEAAEPVGGKVMLPIFAPGENDYLAHLDPVTPAKYREHQKTGIALSNEQLDALSRMKQFTDLNDLAHKGELGLEGLNRQVRSLIDDAIGKHNWKQAEALLEEQTQALRAIHAKKSKQPHRTKKV